jgi:hypothetical protein
VSHKEVRDTLDEEQERTRGAVICVSSEGERLRPYGQLPFASPVPTVIGANN